MCTSRRTITDHSQALQVGLRRCADRSGPHTQPSGSLPPSVRLLHQRFTMLARLQQASLQELGSHDQARVFRLLDGNRRIFSF